jgi:hypothetical protein
MGGDLAVERHGPLGNDPGVAGGDQLQVRRVQRAGVGFVQADFDCNSAIGKLPQTAAGYLGKRVLHRGHDAGDSRGHDRLAARWRLAVMAARFQRDVQRASRGPLASSGQRLDLCMRLAKPPVPPFAHDLPLANDNAAHQWVRLNMAQPLLRPFQGAEHEAGIFGGPHSGAGRGAGPDAASSEEASRCLNPTCPDPTS